MSINEIRRILRAEFGARQYRITSNGEINVFGTMPNSNQEGWYLFGAVGEWETEERIRTMNIVLADGKTKFSTDLQGRVTVEYNRPEWKGGSRITRTFSCPPEGGRVVQILSSGDGVQVCRRLALRGETLTASSRADLINVIRAEYRAMRHAEKREEAKG